MIPSTNSLLAVPSFDTLGISHLLARWLPRNGRERSYAEDGAEPGDRGGRCAGSIVWPTSDSWYSTSRPAETSKSRARRAKSTSMIGSLGRGR